MFELTHFCARGEPFWLNPDLIATLEAHPDTVILMTNGNTVMVSETTAEVVERIRMWRVEIMERAVGSRPLTPVR